MHNSLLEYQSLPIKSLAFNVQVTRMQAHVKIQAVKNWNNPLLNWLSCLLCLHRLHCLLGGFSCCLHRLLCHDVECLENRVTLLRLQLSPWATPHEEFCLAYVNTCCSIFLNIHNTYTWMWAAVREALPLWVIWSLGACDMGPGLHYYIILILEIFVVIVSSPTLKSYSTNFPQLLLCYALSFLQKICSTQSVKVIRYVSLYLYFNMHSLISLSTTFSYPHSYPMGSITYAFW